MTTTSKTATRIMATDPKTGRRYVKTTTIEGATVTVVKFTGVMTGDKYSWSSATYDVTSPPPASELFAASIRWDGKSFKVGSKPAASLSKAVRAVLGTEQPKKDAKPSTRTRKSAATRKAARSFEQSAPNGAVRSNERRSPGAAAQDTAASGSSVIEADPDTGLPRIKPEVEAKADAIVAAQVAKNAEAGK